MRIGFKTKWFAIGFAVRMILGMIIALLSVFSFEAVMLHLADPVIILFALVIEPLIPPAVMNIDPPGGHPLYPIPNLLTSLVWGLAFMLIARLVASWRGRPRPASATQT